MCRMRAYNWARTWRFSLAALIAFSMAVGWRGQSALATSAPGAISSTPDLLVTQQDSELVDDDNDDGDHPDTEELIGVITGLPADGLIGVWIVGGVSVSVTQETELHGDISQFEIDETVKVKYYMEADTNIATEIRLDGDDDDDDDGDDDGDHPDTEELTGVISELPDDDGLIGVWIVGGVSISVTQETELHGEISQFEIDETVKVEYYTEADTNIAAEIKIDDDDDSELGGEFYGIIMDKPESGLIGTWIISGITISTTEETEFKGHSGLFEVGSTVKVEFYTVDDDTHVATEIKFGFRGAKPDDDDDDDDDEQFGKHPGAEGMLFATIDSKSGEGNQLGTWMIGGIKYVVQAKTELDDDDEYNVGDQVVVEYIELNDRVRMATEIEKSDDDGDVEQDGNLKLVGFVDSKPESGFVGEWIIAGDEFSSTVDTMFVEDDDGGLLTVGAYVQVEYTVTQNVRLMHKIETDVPPGAGDNDSAGELQAMGGANAAGDVSVMAASNETWTIDGQTYVVASSTQVIDGDAELTVGDQVLVNSYTDDNGDEVATRIQAVEMNQHLYLPKAER